MNIVGHGARALIFAYVVGISTLRGSESSNARYLTTWTLWLAGATALFGTLSPLLVGVTLTLSIAVTAAYWTVLDIDGDGGVQRHVLMNHGGVLALLLISAGLLGWKTGSWWAVSTCAASIAVANGIVMLTGPSDKRPMYKIAFRKGKGANVTCPDVIVLAITVWLLGVIVSSQP